MTRFITTSVLVGIFLCGCGSSENNLTGSSSAGAAGQGSGATGGASGSGGSAGGSAGSGGSGGGSAGGGGAATCALPVMAPGTSTVTVQSGGQARTARLVVPPGYDGKSYVPLFLMFPGLGETASQLEGLTGMTPIAAAHGIIVAYVQGIGNSLNAGSCCGTASTSQVPDVQFTKDLLDSLESQLCIDTKRVYASGFSNGGMFSSRLGCELADRVAAIAPVSGPIAVKPCTPSRPIAVMEFHGTADLVVPYTYVGVGGALIVADAIKIWKNNAGCTDASPAQVYQKGDTTCTEYSLCKAGAAVELCTVDQGGHAWPGGNGSNFGKQTHDIDASSQMVEFFLAHPLP